MKLQWIAVVCIALFASQLTAAEDLLTTQKEKISYSIGLNIGSNLKNEAIDVDAELVARGLKDALNGGKPLLSDAEVREVLLALQKDLAAKQQEEAKKLGEKNKQEGDAFLAANKTKEGVVALPDGLQYKILKAGTGPKPTLTDTVVTNYRGTFINGTEFDSTQAHGEPATFAVNGVIKGWTEALQLMEVGSKWQLFIPPDLAYGERGAQNVIGPNATLIFEIELVAIK